MGNHIGWSRSRNRSSDYDDDEDLDHNKTGNSSASGSSGASGGSGLKRKYRSSGGHMSSSNLSSNDEPFDEELNTTLSMLLSASGASGSPLSKSKSASLYNRVSNFKMTHRYGDKTASAATGASADLLTPQRKKMKSTSAYIYNTLFKNGENSDIVVRALSREYHLHKLYLCQSPYFDSMFKGSKWKESNQSHIEIAIPDQNINERALDITFGSFYSVEVDIMPVEAVNVLACASLFSLDGLIEQCQSVMLENINAHTVCSYYDASIIYGVSDVANKCLKWFSNNIIINQDLRLGEISPQLFERIVTSPNLMIIRVETDLYSLCKRWLYFQLNKVVAKLEAKSWQKVTNDFFKELIRTLDAAESSSTDNTSLERQSTNRVERFCLLDHPTFAKYLSVFRKIRIKNILGDLDSLKLLYNDRIIPIRWIEPFYYKNWLNLLFVDQDHLSSEYVVEKADFDNECIRFGRILDNDSFYNWRWVRSFHLFTNLNLFSFLLFKGWIQFWNRFDLITRKSQSNSET